jgi:hypothetical protein
MPTSRQPVNIPNQRCGAVGSPVVYDGEEVTRGTVEVSGRAIYERARDSSDKIVLCRLLITVPPGKLTTGAVTEVINDLFSPIVGV